MIFVNKAVVYNRILQFYSRCTLKYRCYSLQDAYNDFTKEIHDLAKGNYTKVNSPNPKWDKSGLNVLRTNRVMWYYAYYEKMGNIYIVDAENYRNMTDATQTHISSSIIQKHKGWCKKNTLPSTAKILNGVYNGYRIGYNNRKYTIIKSDGQPLIPKWFDKRPVFFKNPYGKYNIIAHVSYFGSLYAIDISGRMYDMNRLWSDMYLKECIACIVDEVLSQYKQRLLFESKTDVIRIDEMQFRKLIHGVVSRLIA